MTTPISITVNKIKGPSFAWDVEKAKAANAEGKYIVVGKRAGAKRKITGAANTWKKQQSKELAGRPFNVLEYDVYIPSMAIAGKPADILQALRKAGVDTKTIEQQFTAERLAVPGDFALSVLNWSQQVDSKTQQPVAGSLLAQAVAGAAAGAVNVKAKAAAKGAKAPGAKKVQPSTLTLAQIIALSKGKASGVTRVVVDAAAAGVASPRARRSIVDHYTEIRATGGMGSAPMYLDVTAFAINGDLRHVPKPGGKAGKVVKKWFNEDARLVSGTAGGLQAALKLLPFQPAGVAALAQSADTWFKSNAEVPPKPKKAGSKKSAASPAAGVPASAVLMPRGGAASPPFGAVPALGAGGPLHTNPGGMKPFFG
jgi:hypothetical protein